MNTLYYHGTTAEGLRFTIAGSFEPELKLGLSLCVKEDNFNKKIGRMRAEGRLKKQNKDEHGYVTLPIQTNPKDEIKTFVNAASAFDGKSKNKLAKTFHFKDYMNTSKKVNFAKRIVKTLEKISE
jgi:hypothetical protein